MLSSFGITVDARSPKIWTEQITKQTAVLALFSNQKRCLWVFAVIILDHWNEYAWSEISMVGEIESEALEWVGYGADDKISTLTLYAQLFDAHPILGFLSRYELCPSLLTLHSFSPRGTLEGVTRYIHQVILQCEGIACVTVFVFAVCVRARACVC